MSFQLKEIPWYMENTVELKDVTCSPVNVELGINEIRLFPPTEEQQEDGVVCGVHIITGIADISCEVMETGRRELGLRTDTKYKLRRYVEAQVLRFVMTQVDFVEDEYPNPSII